MSPAALLRKVVHIDMDAFYASVEQRDNSNLAGLPVAVGGRGPRAVVVAASYEARAFGVRSALPMVRALRLCPELVVMPPRFDAYRAVSKEIRGIFLRYTDLVEPLALDEAYLDVTQPKRGPASATLLAKAIKDEIRRETTLTASAGVAGGRFLAKIASGMQKPDGLTVIAPDRAQAFLDALAVEKFFGVGPRTARRLHALGINVGADLRAVGRERLVAEFGKAGATLHGFANGFDDRPVDPNRPRKSIGSETTFDVDLTSRSEVEPWLANLCRDVAESLARLGLSAATVTVKFRFSDFRTVTRSQSPGRHVNAEEDLLRIVAKLAFEGERPDLPIRLLGVSVSRLAAVDDVGEQPSLVFERP
ncbi:MAG TPA: DNA polymerase IV [Trueperaceae bacterium]|nr:DNA polymerase IV [Trueperaceae bacterium]